MQTLDWKIDFEPSSARSHIAQTHARNHYSTKYLKTIYKKTITKIYFPKKKKANYMRVTIMYDNSIIDVLLEHLFNKFTFSNCHCISRR